MACKHGYDSESTCPLCTALDFDSMGEYVLLRDGEWFPTDLLVCDLEDDVFWPESRTPGDADMDWTDLPCILDVVMEPQGNSHSSDKNNSQSSGNEGIIVNNFYSNQYQNSIDLSTAGGNAGGGKTQSGQLSDLLGSAVNAFATAAPLLLDQDTEEMTNLSDRVSKDTAGNTATNTQSTVGRLFGFGRRHKGDHPASCADKATDKVVAAERYYTLPLAEWTTTLAPFQFIRVPLPHALSGESGGVFGSTLRRHYLVKCGWRVQVQCNASQFHSGSLLVFMAPEFPTRQDFLPDSTWQNGYDLLMGDTTEAINPQKMVFGMDHQNFWQWPVYPHQFLNLRTNTTVDLEVPYTNMCPTSSWTQHAQWTLVVAVVSPLRYSSSASPSVGITCSIQPVKPVFNGLRHETLVTQSPFPVTVRENLGMWASTRPDVTTPIYGKTPLPPSDYMVGEFHDLLELARLPTFLGNVSNSVRYPFISTSNTVPTTPLATYQVTLACSCMANTMLAAVARNFNQYRGSLNYSFMFTGCAMAKGKFIISYTPPGAGKPTTRDQAMQGTYAIWDLGLNSTFNFTVPFISPTHYRLTGYQTSTITTVDGWLTIWQLTPLTYPPGAPTSADIITMLSAGSDFTLKHPISPTPWRPQGVDNAEKGKVSDDDATVDFVAEPVPLPENQTKLDFFYDRAVPVGVFSTSTDIQSAFTYSSSSNRPNNCLLTPLPTWNNGDSTGAVGPETSPQNRILGPLQYSNTNTGLKSKQDYPFLAFSPFTYYKADLEVVVSGNTVGDRGILVRWSPCGAPDGVGSVNALYVTPIRETRNPVLFTIGSGTSLQQSFVVPYTSPLSVLPAVWFNGFANFDNSGTFGIAPNADYGRLLFASQPSGGFMTVSIRYKRMKAFCPRPTLYFPWPAETTTKIDMEHPIPVMELQSPPLYRIDLFIHFACDSIFFDYKTSSGSILRYFVRSAGLTPSGRLLVCMGEKASSSFPTSTRYLYHVVFSGTWTSTSVQIYKGRQRPWKHPLREELLDEGFDSFQKFFKFVKQYHKYYYDQRTNTHCPHQALCAPVMQPQAFPPLSEVMQPQDPARMASEFSASKLQHDIETNPGPVMSVFQPQGGALTKSLVPKDTISNLLLQSLGIGNDVGEVANAITVLTDLVKAWETAKSTLHSPEFWTKLVARTTKFIAATVLYLHNPDLTAFVCLTAMTGCDLLTEDSIFSWLKSKFAAIMRTPPPSFPSLRNLFKPQGPLRDTNEGFTFAKNLEWATKTITAIVNWIKSWFEAEAKSPQALLDELLLQFPTHAARIMDMRNGKCSYSDCNQAFSYFEKLYNQAVTCNRVPLANLCEKFKNKHDHAVARVEPVVVVLRGAAGQGKSIACQLIAQSVSKMNLGRQSVYSLPPDSDYFDGYENQYSVIMDDLGQNPDGEDFTVFCQMVSSTNFLPNMAHLEKKGMPFTSQCIVASTNLPQFRPVTIAHYPAVDRRITFDFTLRAGVECKTNNGLLDLEKALKRQDGEPSLDCFTQDCMLLHKRGLLFECNRTHKNYNIQQVIDMVNKKITEKRNNLTQINSLVAQGPNCADKATLESVIVCMRQQHAALRDELDELQEAFQQATERSWLLSDWMKVSAIALAAVASISATIKIFSKIKSSIWPSPTPVVLSEPEQAAYGGKVRSAKTTLQVLDLQGGTLFSQAGNAVMDYEVYCAKNIVSPITFHYDHDTDATQSCLLLKGHLLLVNRHMAETDWNAITVRDVRHNRNEVKCLSVNKQGVEMDLTFIKLSKGPLFKDSTNKFCGAGDSYPEKNDTLTGIMNTGIPFMFTGKMLLADQPANTTTNKCFGHCIHYRANTMRGWCGSALIGIVNGSKKIYGMHSAGGSGLAAATIVTRELIARAETFFQLEPQGAITELEPGRTVHVPRKTKIRKTIAYDIFKPNYEQAVLSRYDPRTDKCVDDVVFSKHTGNVEHLPQVFDMVAQEYANRIFTELGTDNGLISVREAIQGNDGMDPMEKDTSPGLPYTQQNLRRTDLVDFETGKMRPEMDYAHSRLLIGDYSGVLYQSFLKDEIRPTEKVKEAKTRIVDVPPFEHCVFGRQLLGKFASKFQTRPGLTLGSAIGTDPDVDWTRFAVELSQYKYVYDVDYSNFDASHGTAIFEVLIENVFTPDNGFDRRLAGYLRSLAVSTHAYEERRLTVTGGLPSGCAATSMLNTIINNIVIRAGLYMTYKNFEFDDIKILAYGDDLLVATDYEIDFNLVKQRLANFNYKITPANKTTTFPQTSRLKDVTFLKRKFHRFNSYLFAPQMSEESLQAMVSFCKPGTLNEKLQSVALLAVHSGPEVYDTLFAPFRKLGFVIPTYRSMLYRWLNLFN
nr:polyprotein [Vole cardiovirus]